MKDTTMEDIRRINKFKRSIVNDMASYYRYDYLLDAQKTNSIFEEYKTTSKAMEEYGLFIEIELEKSHNAAEKERSLKNLTLEAWKISILSSQQKTKEMFDYLYKAALDIWECMIDELEEQSAWFRDGLEQNTVRYDAEKKEIFRVHGQARFNYSLDYLWKEWQKAAHCFGYDWTENDYNEIVRTIEKSIKS